jgi:hypothetical protein
MSKRNVTHILFPGMNKFYCGVRLKIGHKYATFMQTKAAIDTTGVHGLCPRCLKLSAIPRVRVVGSRE